MKEFVNTGSNLKYETNSKIIYVFANHSIYFSFLSVIFHDVISKLNILIVIELTWKYQNINSFYQLTNLYR